MPRQFIAELQPRESVDEIFRVADKQIRANRQGNDYILLQLMDRSGQISGLRWNVGTAVYETFQKGDFLRVVGMTQLHNGNLQLIVQDFEPVPSEKVDLSNFEKTNPEELKTLLGQLRSRLEALQCPHLKNLASVYMQDEKLMSQLAKAPAGIKTHHAYEGGLLKHVVDLIKVADAVSPHYPQLDGELLVLGVFLHDLGKLDELSFDGDMTYTDQGQLVGHLVQGVVQLEHKLAQVQTVFGQAIPADLVWRLQHMILSHHGYLEHGSPKVPMTLEAIMLAYLDDLDAKMNQATELIQNDRNADSDWTGFHPTLGRKLYKPSLKT